MTIIYWEYEPDCWGDSFTQCFLAAWFTNRLKVLWHFKWMLRNNALPGDKLTSYECLRELGLYMPAKRGQKKDAPGNSRFERGTEMRGNEWKWVNIPITDADIDELSGSESTFEFLAASLCALAGDGIGFSIKLIDSGKSFCVTLNGPDIPGGSTIYGVSSFAGELRDALLVALYKFDIHLEGDWSNVTKLVEAAKPRQRFR